MKSRESKGYTTKGYNLLPDELKVLEFARKASGLNDKDTLLYALRQTYVTNKPDANTVCNKIISAVMEEVERHTRAVDTENEIHRQKMEELRASISGDFDEIYQNLVEDQTIQQAVTESNTTAVMQFEEEFISHMKSSRGGWSLMKWMLNNETQRIFETLSLKPERLEYYYKRLDDRYDFTKCSDMPKTNSEEYKAGKALMMKINSRIIRARAEGMA